jgi:membrane protein DedA with SNARE-associated domain
LLFFDDLTEAIAEALRELFESYGYWVVFLGTILENTLFLGLIVPGALILLAAGLYAHEGIVSLPIAIAVGIGGTIIGDSVSHMVGRLGWYRVLHNRSLGRWTEQFREPLMRWSSWFVLFYHFGGYSRMVGPMGAGLLRMPLRRWAPIDYAGATLWVSSHVLAGYVLGILGVTLDPANERFRVFEWLLFVLFVVWVLIVLRSSRHLFEPKPSPERQGEPAPVPVPSDDPPDDPTQPDAEA